MAAHSLYIALVVTRAQRSYPMSTCQKYCIMYEIGCHLQHSPNTAMYMPLKSATLDLLWESGAEQCRQVWVLHAIWRHRSGSMPVHKYDVRRDAGNSWSVTCHHCHIYIIFSFGIPLQKMEMKGLWMHTAFALFSVQHSNWQYLPIFTYQSTCWV